LSTALQDIRKKIDAYTLMVRNWTDTLPIFKFEVTVIQRRTARRLVIEYLDRKRSEIATILNKKRSEEDGGLIVGMIVDTASAATRTNLRPKTSPSTPLVVISADGELSVSRSQVLVGMPLDETKFYACLDEIKKHINEDPIDAEAPPDIVAKSFLVEVYRTRSSNLPTFRKAI